MKMDDGGGASRAGERSSTMARHVRISVRGP